MKLHVMKSFDLSSNVFFTVVVGLAVLAFIIVMELREEARQVYTSKSASLFPRHVIRFVNVQFAQKGDIRNFRYVPASETIEQDKDSFIFSCWISIDKHDLFSKDGFVRVVEYGDGQLVLDNIECPDRGGRWFSYKSPDIILPGDKDEVKRLPANAQGEGPKKIDLKVKK